MTTTVVPRRVLVIGGLGGLVGRALAPELLPEYRVRSVHRHPVARESLPDVEWVPADVRAPVDWSRWVTGVDAVVNLAWYRWARPEEFRRMYEGLRALLDACRAGGVTRFIHLSVPPAPAKLETGLPYLVWKRRFDRDLAESALSYRILCPTALFAPGDVLLGVLLRQIRRYPVFPMFGDGNYHLSPIAAADLARAIRLELQDGRTGTVLLGGPRSYRYRELTDLMFRLLGKRPRYWTFSPKGSVRLASILQTFGSSLLYAYEVEWLLADMLALPPYAGLDRPLTPVEPYLEREAARFRPR